MDPACPTAECIAGDHVTASGEATNFGNTTGTAGKSVWFVRSRPRDRDHRQPSHGYGLQQ
mgnify:CR=1 FL=1|jgi:hypothetical protein